MAVKRPSFLKKLKEQARRAKADQKRESRRARKIAKTTQPDELSPDSDLTLMESPEGDTPEGETPEPERSES